MAMGLANEVQTKLFAKWPELADYLLDLELERDSFKRIGLEKGFFAEIEPDQDISEALQRKLSIR
jgi:hypothetical protein